LAKARAIESGDITRFLNELLNDDEHAKRVQSLSNATLGVITSASLAVHAIGQGLAHAQGLMPKHAVKQVDRLLSNRGIEVNRYFAYWVPHVIGEQTSIRVAMDWTEFDADGQATLALSLITGQGRAMPLLWRTVRPSELVGGRPAIEDALLCRLYEVLPCGIAVTIVADRWFGDCALLELLSEELHFGYVIRIRGNHYITTAKGERRKAKDWVGAGGRARTLRAARVTVRNEYPVATVVCLKDKGMKEPWCLVASDPQASAKTLKTYYGQRWGIEASFRDIKDLRFGMGMASLRVSAPERRDRLLLISALAMALLTILGATGEALGYDRMLKANTVKRRTHSLFRQGCMLYDWLPRMPDKYFEPLIRAFAGNLGAHRGLAIVFALGNK
jgi:Transposase DDE domain